MEVNLCSHNVITGAALVLNPLLSQEMLLTRLLHEFPCVYLCGGNHTIPFTISPDKAKQGGHLLYDLEAV